jgi:hypothetical protein
MDGPIAEQDADSRNGAPTSGNCWHMPQVKHGSAASYESGKCRCAQCREAGMRARRVQRERRRERVAAGDATHVAHGTWAAYVTDKCRCDECRAFKSAYMKAYRANRAASTEA